MRKNGTNADASGLLRGPPSVVQLRPVQRECLGVFRTTLALRKAGLLHRPISIQTLIFDHCSQIIAGVRGARAYGVSRGRRSEAVNALRAGHVQAVPAGLENCCATRLRVPYHHPYPVSSLVQSCPHARCDTAHLVLVLQGPILLTVQKKII